MEAYEHANDPAYFGLTAEQLELPVPDLPLRKFVAKVHSRCDLACPNCYVFGQADQSWRQLPNAMPPKTVRATAWRIGQHAAGYGLEVADTTLHGGEPTLIGADGIDFFADTLRQYMPPETEVKLSIQTNGIRIGKPEGRPIVEALRRNKIRTGVSIDGLPSTNDISRPHHDGSSSFDETVQTIRLLRREYPDIFAGVLVTINPNSDPIETYDFATELAGHFDLLIPHYNWTNRPPSNPVGSRATPIADWVITVFDHWRAQPTAPRIRLFESIIAAVIGRPSRSDRIGRNFPNVVVIDTDGAIELDDAFLATYEHATTTGLNVHTDELSKIRTHPIMRAQQIGMAALSRACQACTVGHICWGGHPAHRWDEDNGFDNPSVYCRDLMKIIHHVRGVLIKQLKPHLS